MIPIRKKIRDHSGFTLIELLVVISIIGLLASIVLVSLNKARMKARDARRIADIRQIRLALELFYDEYGHYPRSGNCGATIPNGGWCNSVQGSSGGSYWLREGSLDLSEFIPKAPNDPNQGTVANWIPAVCDTYYYFGQSYGSGIPESQWYMIVYCLENYPNPQIENQDGVTAPDGTYFHYGDGSNGVITVGVGG